MGYYFCKFRDDSLSSFGDLHNYKLSLLHEETSEIVILILSDATQID